MAESSSQMEVVVEVLVIGGGIQGVVALAELHKQNFKTLLVTESDIGSGQTLSSQAYLHSGYPWAQHEEVVTDIKKAANFWLKWMKDNNIPYNSAQKYFAGPKPFVETLKSFWHKSELSFQVLQKKTTLPDIFKEGKLFASTTSVVRIQDFTFDIDKLLRVLCTPLNAFMIKGKVISLCLNEQNNEISSATILLSNNKFLTVKAKYFVTATGVSTSNLLESIHCSDSLKRKNHLEAEKIQRHYASHIICLRGKSELFPPLSGIFQAFGLFIVGHEETTDQGQKLTYWLVNPVSLKSMQFGFGSSRLENPHSAPLSRDVIGEGLGFLFDCCPRLRELAPQLDWSVYSCYRQDYPEKDHFSMIHVEEFHSISNLCVCLPSLFSLSYVVAEKLLQKVSSKLRPPSSIAQTTAKCDSTESDHNTPSSVTVVLNSVSNSHATDTTDSSLQSPRSGNPFEHSFLPPNDVSIHTPATSTGKMPPPGNVRRLSANFEALRRINSGVTIKGNSLPNHLFSTSTNLNHSKSNTSIPPLPLNTTNSRSPETPSKTTTSLVNNNRNDSSVGPPNNRRPSTPRLRTNIPSLLSHSSNPVFTSSTLINTKSSELISPPNYQHLNTTTPTATATMTMSPNTTNVNNNPRTSISHSQLPKVLTFQEETIASIQQSGAKVDIGQQQLKRSNFKWMKWHEFSELYPTKISKNSTKK